MTTKTELLAVAKELNIVGRHEMTKDDLEAAVAAAQAQTEDTLTGGYIYTPPFRGRPYMVVTKNQEAYDALPPQAKQIFDFMEKTKIVDVGANIVKHAVAQGALKTQQDPAVLFAFYARKLENAGVRLAK